MPYTRSVRAVEPLEPRTLLAAQLVADLNTAPASSNPEQSISVNGVTYFVADDGVHGREVWRTDGTPAGTQLLRDIAPGTDSGSPNLLGAAGNRAYFEVYGQLWQTDPTTGDVSPVQTGDGSYYYGSPSAHGAAALGDDFYVIGQNGLYRIHDGYFSRLSDLGSGYVEGVEVVTAGQNIYALTKNTGLWVSDGTAEGTRLVKPVTPSGSQYSLDLVALGDAVYFTVENPVFQSYQIWKSQGTGDTTSLVFESFPNNPPAPIIALGGNVYFWNRNPRNYAFEYDLCKTDGTPEGTSTVTTVPNSGYHFPPPTLLAVGPQLFFPVSDELGISSKLWTTDGTPGGTRAVRNDLTLTSDVRYKSALFAGGGAVYFIAVTPTSGYQVWSTSDGTPATTRQVGAIPANQAAPPGFVGLVGTRPLLAHTDAKHAREPWIANAANTAVDLLKDISTGTADANVARPAGVNGRVLVPIDQDLWLFPTPGSIPQHLTVGVGGPQVNRTGAIARVGNQIFLTSYVAGLTYPQLLVTDGTPAGTRIVTQVPGGLEFAAGVLPYQGFAVGDRFYFTSGRTGDQALYVSDGTAAGTRHLVGGYDQIANSATRNHRAYAVFKGRLYFAIHQNYSTNDLLWRTDGTTAGTVPVTPNPYPSPGQILSLTPAGNYLYFLWDNRLWRTDGTRAGTVAMGDTMYSRIEPTDDGGLILLEYNGGHVAKLPPGGATPAPLLPDLIAGYDSARVDKWVYFVASRQGAYGIWRTDGSAANTTLVTTAAQPQDLTLAAGALYFTATGAAGREVYVTDGTPAGTRLVADVAPGQGSSFPGNLVEADGTLYFTADDGVHGIELWRADDDVAPAAFNPTFNPAANALSVTLRFTEDVSASLALADFKLTDRATGADVSDLLASLTFDTSTYAATLKLPPTFARGDYRLTLPAGAVADASGHPSPAATTFDFFQLPGDINRDRVVNFDDLLILAKNYDKLNLPYSAGELNGDVWLNFDDLLILAKNYNTALPPLPAATTTAAPTLAAVSAPNKTTARPKPAPVFATTPVAPKRPPAPPKRPTPTRTPH